MLRELSLLPVYDSSEHDLVRDLQVPLLKHSTDYLRGVGFFTSGWLGIASRGMADFVQRGGKARIVLSPILERKDWEALQSGDQAKYDEALKSLLAERIQDLRTSLEKDTLNVLAWMVADGILTFRFAVPRQLGYPGNYHDKVGVFVDGLGDAVAIHGSLNDSIQGSLNGEAFSVFKSWDEGQRPYFEKHVSRLEALWNGRNTMFRVSEVAEATRDGIVQLRTTSQRPYSLPGPRAATESLMTPHCPVTLHPFQRDAMERWRESGYRGILEMATGTGKTVTSLAAAVDKYRELGKLVLIVLVPYLHLLEQWQRNCRDFGFNPVLCSSKHDGWQVTVKSQIQDFNLGTKPVVCIIAVHATAATPRFQAALSRLRPEITMLIGDEVHALGAPQLRNALTERSGNRLGLSATPRRWFDDEGTSVIFSYFGKTCFEFTLEQAIGKYLTPYRYYPQLVNLTDQEVAAYEDLTQRITRLRGKANDPDVTDRIKRLLLRRARIISSAEQKLPALLNLLGTIVDEDNRRLNETRGILVYCAPGSHRSVLQGVAGLGLRCHEFVHEVSLPQRERLLSQFGNGDIQALVAMKCLDEGVDVPSTRQAFILASSTNPREFVQRRGRLLRLAKDKTEAVVYDYIVVPPPSRLTAGSDVDANVLRREMPRFVEFASCSLNEFEARAQVRDILDRHEMLNLLDEKPWDVYHSLKQWDWEINE
jgi:superfamily II DNA or RNA helicase